jgi:hypothetical protein
MFASMFGCKGFSIGLTLLILTGGVSVRAAAQAPETFEALLQRSSPSADLPTLVTPFLDDCSTMIRSEDRARCGAMTRFLKQQLPGRSYSMVVDDPASVRVSDYDGRIKGVALGVVGCLACTRPVAIGTTSNKRLVTLRAPDKTGHTLAEGVEVASAELSFGGVPESKLWLEQVRPHLRAEFVFQPENKEWSFGPARGFAFKLLGSRVFNRCTGEVVFSQPPSSEPAKRFDNDGSCRGGAAGREHASSSLPAMLSAVEINRGMTKVAPLIDKCIGEFNLRGSANLRFVVSGANGIPLSVAMDGSLEGTALGSCILEVARKARFPQFTTESQKFTYPVILRRR